MSKVNYATLIKDAISTLKERGGSSLQAIKKYAANNKIEIQNVSMNCLVLLPLHFSHISIINIFSAVFFLPF